MKKELLAGASEKVPRRTSVRGFIIGEVYYLKSLDYTVEEIIQEIAQVRAGFRYEDLVNAVVSIRKNYDPEFMKGELRQDVIRQERERLDLIFSSSRDPEELEQAFASEGITSKYILEARKKGVLATLKEVAQLAGCPYAGPIACKVVTFLRKSEVCVGEYVEKKYKDLERMNSMYLIPLAFKQEAVTKLKWYVKNGYTYIKQVGGGDKRPVPPKVLFSDEVGCPYISLFEVVRENQVDLIDEACPVPVYIYEDIYRVAKSNIVSLQEYITKQKIKQVALMRQRRMGR